MKILNLWLLIPATTLFLSSCDGVRDHIEKKMEEERAYQAKQQAQREAIESVWKFKEQGYDLEVRFSDEDEHNKEDTAYVAKQTSEALREIAGFPHLNLREQGGKLGTIKVHYLVGHSDFVSEDGQLTWKIPSTLISTFDVDAKSNAGNWAGQHQAMANSDVVREVTEISARGYAQDQWQKLIESSVSQLKAQLGEHPQVQ